MSLGDAGSQGMEPDENAVAARAAACRSRRAAIAGTRTYYLGMAAAALGGGLFATVAVAVMGAWFIAPFSLAIAVVIAALMLQAASRFRPLPGDLATRGRATPAVVLAAQAVGPSLRAFGFGDGSRSQRQSEIRIEVRPPGQSPYHAVLTTFDSPRPIGLQGRPLTVYVDPADPLRIFPDWTTADAEF